MTVEVTLNTATGELFICAGGIFTPGGTLPGAVNGGLPAASATPPLVPLDGTVTSFAGSRLRPAAYTCSARRSTPA